MTKSKLTSVLSFALEVCSSKYPLFNYGNNTQYNTNRIFTKNVVDVELRTFAGLRRPLAASFVADDGDDGDEDDDD